MGLSIQSGDVLGEAFELRERLLAHPMSELWSGLDLAGGSPRLLRVYEARSAVEGSSVLAMRLASGSASLVHESLAATVETREADGLVVTVLEHRSGRVLSTIRDASPMTYRDLLRLSRPVIEALLGVHAMGIEHGRVDQDHVLASEAGWVLLPPDVTIPSRPDVRAFGHFLAERLTGGCETLPAAHLNDTPELLHAGRTIPAMLDGLIHDLRAGRVGTEPVLLRGVLDRFDQLERLTEREIAAPATRGGDGEDRAPRFLIDAARQRARDPRGRRWPAIVIGMGCVVIVVVVALIGVVGPGVLESVGETARPSGIDGDAAEVVGDGVVLPDLPESDPSDADAALEALLEIRAEADSIGASVWAGAAHEAAVSSAASGDAFYIDGRFEEAAAEYREAARALREIVAGSQRSYERLISEGHEALARVASESARASFSGALLIRPDSEVARIGLVRSSTIEAVAAHLRVGSGHERAGRLALALVEYAQALAMDEHAQEAAEAHARVLEAISDREFSGAMGRGLSAYHAGDLAAATELLGEAERLRPSGDASRALAMVREEALRRRLDELDTSARTHAMAERWQEARADWVRLLGLDPTVEAAQEGRLRAETMIELEAFAREYISDPDLLMERGGRDEGAALLRELRALEEIGPRLREVRRELDELVRLASTPRLVVLESDGRTEIEIYHVGRFEPFRSLELELLPGEYTVVGHRDGYRDVRATLRIEPGGGPETLLVVCTEPI